jgi:hypothetical protein
MVGEKDTVPVPPPTMAPPLEAVYQSIVQPAGGVALKVTVPPPQRELALALVGTVGTALIVAVVADDHPL